VESNPGHSNFAARRRSLAPKDKGSLGLKKKLPVLVVPATAAEAANRRQDRSKQKTEDRKQGSGLRGRGHTRCRPRDCSGENAG